MDTLAVVDSQLGHEPESRNEKSASPMITPHLRNAPVTDLPTSFVATLTTAAGNASVVVHVNKIQLEIWGLHESVPWMIIGGYFSEGTVTQNKTVDGDQIIVNWRAAQFVKYDNPWAHISRENAVKFAK